MRVYDCNRFLTTLEKSSGPRSSLGSFTLPGAWPGPSSSPLLAGRLGGRPGILGLERGEMPLEEDGEAVADEVAEDVVLLAAAALALALEV